MERPNMSPGRRRRTTYIQRAMRRRHAEELERAGRRAWLIAAAATLLGLSIIGFLGCRARNAYAATRVRMEWTAPGSVEHYEALARRPDGVFTMPSVWADSSGANFPAVLPAGQRQVAWVAVSEDWRAGSWMLWIRGCVAGKCGAWSNATVVLAGIPDTLWMLSRPVGARYRAPLDGASWKRAGGRVGWALQFSDSVAPATILHQEAVQRAERARLCALFGAWALRGGLQPCP